MTWLVLLGVGVLTAEWRCRRSLSRLQPLPTGRLFDATRLLPDLLALTALGLLLVSLTPSEPTSTTDAPGPAVALVVDVSRSMQVSDQRPDRLGRARLELLALLDRLPQARFSLIPFAGEPVLQVPLTGDHAALRFFINTLQPDQVAARGSAPEEAVRFAQQRLQDVAGERMVLLLSDGERTIGEAPPALLSTIPVYAIQAGSVDGGPVTVTNGGVSRADRQRLLAIARQTGGSLLASDRTTTASASLPLTTPTAERTKTATLLPLLALLLLALRWLPLGRRPTRGLLVGLLLLTAQLPGCSDGPQPQPTPRQQFAQALQAATMDETTAAAAFANAATRLYGEQRGLALYNQATLLLQHGAVEDAIPLLEEALGLIPGDIPSRDNLLLALRRQQESGAAGQADPDQPARSDNETMTTQLAEQLLDSARIAPTALPVEANLRPATVLKEW